MRKIIVSILSLIALYGFTANPSYTVTGVLRGKGSGVAYLMEYKGKGVYNYIDSAQIVNGQFVMKGSVPYPRSVIFSINRGPGKFAFWLENSSISVNGHFDSLHRTTVTGSATQLEYEKTREFLAPYDRNCRGIAAAMNRKKTAGDEAGAKVLERSLDSCWASKVSATVQYIKQHPSSWPAASLIKGVSYALTWQQLEKLINSLSPEISASGAMAAYRERIEILKRTDKGDKAPDFTQNNPDGQPIRLYEKLSANKIVLLDFWAAWCGPCRRENPNLVAVYKEFHSKGFDIIGVSLDKTKEAWIKAIKDDGLSWTHVSNLQYWNNPIVELYGISSVPANVLISSDGTILARNLKGDALKNKVRKLLDKPGYAQGGHPFRKLPVTNLPGANVAATAYIQDGSQAALITGKDSVLAIYRIHHNTAQLLHTIAFNGDVLHIASGDVDNDGQNELAVATGRRGYDKNTPVRVYLVEYEKGKWLHRQLYEKKSERPQVTSLLIADCNNDGRKEIVVSYFESKYFVETAAIGWKKNSGRPEAGIIAKERMAMSRDIGMPGNSNQQLTVVGRPYGDSIGAAGDAYIGGPNKQLLPAYRGVKTVRIGDGDNDGRNEIYVGDGWHQDYGKMARGRIAVITPINGSFNYELIEDVKGQYEILQIQIADIDNDGKNELLTRGNRFFRIYRKEKGKWKVFSDTALPVAPFTVGDVNGDGNTDVIFTSSHETAIYNFAQIPYSADLDPEVRTEKVDPASLIGKKAPELRMMKWYKNTGATLHDLKGKVVILDFWATWCRPCIKMFPTLREWQKKYHSKGLRILGITREDNTQSADKIEAFAAKEHFPYPVGISEEAFNNLAYGVGGIPHLVLIDKKGYIRKYEVGVRDDSDLEVEIVKLLNE